MDFEMIEILRSKRQPIIQYVHPCMNYYNLISASELLNIYRQQNEDSQTNDELMQHLVEYFPYCELYDMQDGIIFSREDLEEEDYIEDALEITKDKPLFIPTKEELMEHTRDYEEETPQLLALKEFLTSSLEFDKEELQEYIHHLSFEFYIGSKPSDLEGLLFEALYDKSSPENVVLFIKLVTDYYNNYRTWRRRCFTPIELSEAEEPFKIGLPSKSEFVNKKSSKREDIDEGLQDVFNETLDDILEQGGIWKSFDSNGKELCFDEEFSDYEVVDEEAKPLQAVSCKIRRNEPCPCGSGKKYKKCCGKLV